MTTIEKISKEIEAIKSRMSEITQQLGEFWRENDNDAYSIIWPAWALKADAESELLHIDLKDAERRLAKEEDYEQKRAERRAAEQAKEERESFLKEKAAVAAADPREMWAAVNAHRANSGMPALAEGFIGSAHVQRIALTLGLFAK
jgi:hypothetical protein